MKKFLVAIMAILYMSTSIGATVQLHYCMGKLSDWGMGHHESTKCGKCGMKKSANTNKGCCNDQHKFFKNDTDQKTASAAFQLMEILAAAAPVPNFYLAAPAVSSITESAPLSHAPPLWNARAVYILNCLFLI